MIVVLDPTGWFADDLPRVTGNLPVRSFGTTREAGAAAADDGGFLLVCHPDGAAGEGLLRDCLEAGTFPALLLCGPDRPPETVAGGGGALVLSATARGSALRAVADLLALHEQAAAAEREAREALHEARRSGGRRRKLVDLMGRASHDLRNPLAVVRGYISLILEGRFGATREELLEAIGIMNRRIGQMELLVGQLVELGRVEGETAALSLEAVNATEVVGRAGRLLEDAMRERGISLQVVTEGPSTLLRADSDKLITVARHLLANAVRNGRRGGVIRVRLSEANGYLAIDISDDGEGIDPARGVDAFQRFFEDPDDLGEAIGAGIGLTLVREYVRLHGGMVTVRSVAGAGTTFTVLLPLTGPLAGQR